jgi:hypothetical protein
MGMNIRYMKVDTSGGNPSSSELVHLLAGERVGTTNTETKVL